MDGTQATGNLAYREKFDYRQLQPEWRRTELCNFLDPFNFGHPKRFPHLSRRCSARTLFVPFLRENASSGTPGRRIRLRLAAAGDVHDDVDSLIWEVYKPNDATTTRGRSHEYQAEVLMYPQVTPHLRGSVPHLRYDSAPHLHHALVPYLRRNLGSTSASRPRHHICAATRHPQIGGALPQHTSDADSSWTSYCTDCVLAVLRRLCTARAFFFMYRQIAQIGGALPENNPDIDLCNAEVVDGHTNGRTDGRPDGRTGGRTDGLTD